MKNKREKKISATLVVALIIVFGIISFVSIYAYKRLTQPKDAYSVVIPTKILATDSLSIDSLKNQIGSRFQFEIDSLKDRLIVKDTIILSKTTEYRELHHNFDSVRNKLDEYRTLLRQKRDTTNK